MKESLLFSIADHITPKIDDEGMAYTLESRDYKNPQAIAIENHPNDSRVKISSDGIVQTLSSRMGTGGGQCADGNGGRNGMELDCQKTHSS